MNGADKHVSKAERTYENHEDKLPLKLSSNMLEYLIEREILQFHAKGRKHISTPIIQNGRILGIPILLPLAYSSDHSQHPSATSLSSPSHLLRHILSSYP